MTKDEKLEYLVSKFREKIEKNSWHDNEDIYVLVSAYTIYVYGHDGKFYGFTYMGGDDWVISTRPKDPYGKKVWHGLGRGWEDVHE